MSTVSVKLDKPTEPPYVPDGIVLEYLRSDGEAETPECREHFERLRRDDVTRPVIYIGTGTCGLGAGAGKVHRALKAHLAAKGIDGQIVEVGCVGLCAFEPVLDVQLPGRNRVSFMQVTEENVAGVLDAVLAGDMPKENLIGQYRSQRTQAWSGVPYVDEHPFFKPQLRWVLEFSGIIEPTSIEEYIAHGGYCTFLKTIRTWTREEICKMIEKSGLRGRGGGGFPTGKKWTFALKEASDQKYLICNADEGDPGAFMDRALVESDPHRLLEGMMIAAYAIGASKAYVYIRAEYPLAVRRLRAAIEQARAYGLVGRDIMKSGFSLEFIVKMGAGAFVCGEETALIHSVEGKRGMPRPRPPYPAVSGLFGKPTVINNVETLANVPAIVRNGPDWFSSVGTASSKGTKIFALSGKVNRTGLVEVPMGTTVRHIVFDIGGGIPGGKAFKAVQIGGPSGGCLPTQLLDTPIDYESVKSAGAIMGSGGLVTLDETTCMVDLAKFFLQFVQNESCGKCIPCREGTKRMLEILEAITRPHHQEKGLDSLIRFQGVLRLKELAEIIKQTSLCGLGQTAPSPVLSTLRWFRDEYEAHVFERRCPAGACKDLVGAVCQNACPVGTEVWRYVAHVARGEYEEAYRVIRSANPFPSICARVCNHPCEDLCRAGATGGQSIAVRALKRFVVDHVSPEAFFEEVRPAAADALRIAVVGAGPAGLAAAHYLGKTGFKLTVFERESVPGGMLLAGIPGYRLPRELIRKEIDALFNENVELRLNQALGRDFTVDTLFRDGYKAVYLALGAHRSRKLGVPGEDGVEGVIHGIRFLKAFNLQEESLAKGKVGIIGGGNSALDAARVAVRQEDVTSVTIYYRRTRDEMPAYAEEIVAALAEGIILRVLVSPVEVLSAGGRLTGVKFIDNKLGQPDASGRRSPVPLPGSEHVEALDTLIVAISESPETMGLDGGVIVGRDGTVAVNLESYLTDRPGVFAGGDVVTGPNTVIEAIAAGKRVAGMIRNYVTGRLLKTLSKVQMPSFYIKPLDEEEAPPVARVVPPELPADRRRSSFQEVELCISEGAARCEARRCLRCDLSFTQPGK